MPGIVWFYPLCMMEISYYEVLGFLWMSPVLMKVQCIRRFVTSPCGLMLLRAMTMIGVGSFLAPTTIVRLILSSIGNFFAILSLAGSLWDKSRIDRQVFIFSRSEENFYVAKLVQIHSDRSVKHTSRTIVKVL